MWMEYLDARMNLIREWRTEGRSHEQIFKDLSVVPMQVMMLCMEADKKNGNPLNKTLGPSE